jgi:hypothetical protein
VTPQRGDPSEASAWVASGLSLRKLSRTLEHFSRARVGFATHRTASLKNHRCCLYLL